MIRFLHPEWLLFVPFLIFVGWKWPRYRLHRPLRVFCLALLILGLVRPEMRIGDTAMDLWLLLDRSASANDLVEPNVAEWVTLLERSKGKNDRVRVIDFAGDPISRDVQDRVGYHGDKQQTRLGLAIHHVLSLMSKERANRILVMTDGYSTESLQTASERLLSQEVPVDVRLLAAGATGDVLIRDLAMPSQVQVQEPFLVEVQVSGTVDGPVPYEVFVHRTRVGRGTVEISGGVGTIRFSDRQAAAGAYPYQVQLVPEVDAFPGNNIAKRWIEISGGPRLLLVSGLADDPLARMLAQQGFDVQVVTDSTQLHEGLLLGVKSVLFNQFPAYKVPTEFLKAIDFFVRHQGGGLMMAGGEMSFGSGGYYGSAIDPLLPVSMELKEEHRKLSTAMAIIMDRSGSMGASVSAGVSKMDLANEGAARTIELLGQHDSIAVFAVDSEAHEIIPLTQVGPARGQLIDTVRRIQSSGGGIYVYNGLKAGWKELSKANVGQRHLILFSDAADSEQPGEYKQLLDDMAKGGATVSVIGLGSEADSDAKFLQDIAMRGSGRMFFNANPADLPALFAQEAVSVARSAFIEDPVALVPSAGWLEIAGRELDWLPQVDGYNLSYLRPEASAGALSGDEYEAPLVAFWHRGVGRAATVLFPLSGPFSASVRAWPRAGDLVQTLARWLMGEPIPPGIGLRHRLVGTSLTVDLFFDESWQDQVAQTGPSLLMVKNQQIEPTRQVWQRMKPGHMQAVLELDPQSVVRGAVHVADVAIPFGPITVGTSPEWAFDSDRLDELKNLSLASGGEQRLELTDVWEAPRRSAFQDMRPWVALLLLIAFLVEALLSRLGWQMPAVRLSKRWWRPEKRVKLTAPPPVPPTTSPSAETESKPAFTPPAEDTDRKNRFRRAKRK